MSTETRTVQGFAPAVDVAIGLVSGLVAGVFGSIVLVLLDATDVIAAATPSLVGLSAPAPAAGQLLFLLGCVLFGVAYAALVDAVDPGKLWPYRGAAAGAAYGVALWLLVAVVAVPLVLPAVGYAGAPAFPYVDATALAAYAAVGVVLGALHASLDPRHADEVAA